MAENRPEQQGLQVGLVHMVTACHRHRLVELAFAANSAFAC